MGEKGLFNRFEEGVICIEEMQPKAFTFPRHRDRCIIITHTFDGSKELLFSWLHCPLLLAKE